MDDIIPLLNVFAPVFSLRVWPSARLLLIGALLTPSARTVASVVDSLAEDDLDGTIHDKGNSNLGELDAEKSAEEYTIEKEITV